MVTFVSGGDHFLGRNKEFDTALVLHRAIEVFGEYGYEGTSLQDLLSHLGIARQSLYDTYGTKRDLFLSAVKSYLEGKNAAVMERLEAPGSVKEAIRDIFQEGVEEFTVAELTMLAQSEVTLPDDAKEQFEKLIDALEDLEDVQQVYHNVDLGE